MFSRKSIIIGLLCVLVAAVIGLLMHFALWCTFDSQTEELSEPCSAYSIFDPNAVISVQLGGYFESGVIVSENGYIITAAHTFNRFPETEHCSVMFKDGKKTEIADVCSNLSPVSDVVILKIDSNSVTCSGVLAGIKNVVGKEVVCFGLLPENVYLRIPGAIVGYFDSWLRSFDHMVICTDISGFPGISGGPLVDISTGEILGIASYASSGYTYFIPSEFLKQALNEARGL